MNLRQRRALWGSVGLVLLLAGTAEVGWVTSIPQLTRYLNNKGVLLQHRGELQGAINCYQRAIMLDANYAEAHYNLADAFEEIPNYDKAQSEYQRAIEADLRFYPAYNNLARLDILRLREYGAALRLLDHGLGLKPVEPSVQYSLHKNYGWAESELGNLSQAELELRTAIGLDHARGSAHCLLAKVLEGQGRASDARREWEPCVAYSSGADVEPEWRVEGQERLNHETAK